MELSDTYWGAFTYRCDMHKRQIRDGDGLTLGHRWQPMKHSFSALPIPREEGKLSLTSVALGVLTNLPFLVHINHDDGSSSLSERRRFRHLQHKDTRDL